MSTEKHPLVEAAIEAIEAVFGDTSVSLEETLDRLDELKEAIQQRQEAINADLNF